MWKAEILKKCPCMLIHTYDLGTWEAEAGRSWVQGQPGLQDEIPIQRMKESWIFISGILQFLEHLVSGREILSLARSPVGWWGNWWAEKTQPTAFRECAEAAEGELWSRSHCCDKFWGPCRILLGTQILLFLLLLLLFFLFLFLLLPLFFLFFFLLLFFVTQRVGVSQVSS